MSLYAELRRRKVFKAGAAYLIVAWLVVQAASIGFPAFDAPPWALRVFILIAFLGFPVALVLAWVLEVTPEGLKVESAPVGNARMFLIAGALAVLALAWYFIGQPTYRQGDGPPAGDSSVAVLPFANMSNQPDEDYFSDGMTEELLNVLARNPKLKVAARTSVFEFKGKGGDVREIGAKLGVGHIVEGSVRRERDQVRVTAQLIRVADGFHVWTESYDRRLESVFALQDELARSIGEQLQATLGVADAPPARAEIDPAAYDEYLKGRALYRRRHDLPVAVRHLARAVEIAPDFGAGWASLALAHEVVYWTTTEAERRAVGDSYAQLIAATERATMLAPSGAMTLHARANVARAQGRYVDAERLYRESMAADASYPDVREDHSELLAGVGRDREAEAAIRALLALEPRVALYWWRLASLGIDTDNQQWVDEATARIREIDPDYEFGLNARVLLPLARGDLDTARRELAALLPIAPGGMADDAVLLPWAAREPGADDAEARRLVREMVLRAQYALVRGELDLVLAGFDQESARVARHSLFLELSSPVARRWLGDPRVRDVLVRYGYVAYWRERGWPALCRPLGDDDFECGAPATAKSP